MMTFLIRTDASLQTGTGHVMRCLTLAEALRENASRVHFISREKPGHLHKLIQERGFSVSSLPFDPSLDEFSIGGGIEEEMAILDDLSKKGKEDTSKPYITLIIDHYGIDREYEEKARQYVDKIMVIDDLADREHDCDLLLNQNYAASVENYRNLVPELAKLLLGPEYALLRKEFRKARQKLETGSFKEFDKSKVLVFFGGSDPDNYTETAIRGLKDAGDFQPEVVIGQNHPAKQQIKDLVDSIPGARLHIQVNNMAEIMMGCSWYLGAGGSVTWERMALGLTGVVIPIAENQRSFINALGKDGYHYIQQDFEFLKNADYMGKVYNRIASKQKKVYQLCDGSGVQRITGVLSENHYTL